MTRELSTLDDLREVILRAAQAYAEADPDAVWVEVLRQDDTHILVVHVSPADLAGWFADERVHFLLDRSARTMGWQLGLRVRVRIEDREAPRSLAGCRAPNRIRDLRRRLREGPSPA
jgi:hypothetical protein